MAMKIRPLKDRVLIRPIEEETKTAGGIYLPDTAKERPVRGEVVAVGSWRLTVVDVERNRISKVKVEKTVA